MFWANLLLSCAFAQIKIEQAFILNLKPHPKPAFNKNSVPGIHFEGWANDGYNAEVGNEKFIPMVGGERGMKKKNHFRSLGTQI